MMNSLELTTSLIIRYYIFPNVFLRQVQNQWNWMRSHCSASSGSSTIRLEMSWLLYTTRLQRVPYKCRHIYRNSSVITGNFLHENLGKRKGKEVSHWRYSMVNMKTCKRCMAQFVLALTGYWYHRSREPPLKICTYMARLSLEPITRAIRRRVPYKLRKICRNQLVVICTLYKKGQRRRWHTAKCSYRLHHTWIRTRHTRISVCWCE